MVTLNLRINECGDSDIVSLESKKGMTIKYLIAFVLYNKEVDIKRPVDMNTTDFIVGRAVYLSQTLAAEIGLIVDISFNDRILNLADLKGINIGYLGDCSYSTFKELNDYLKSKSLDISQHGVVLGNRQTLESVIGNN